MIRATSVTKFPSVSFGGQNAEAYFARSGKQLIFQWQTSDSTCDQQYIINLDAGVQLTASDGETRRVKAGEVVLVEDTWGKGHLSKALEAKIRHCIFVPID